MVPDAPPVAAVYKRSVLIACIVCPILTLINQWEQITAWSGISVTKIALTFLVPFIVSTVSALMARKRFAKVLAAKNQELSEALERAKTSLNG